MARGIAGEKFDIVKKWGINTYKVGFKHLSLPPNSPGYLFPIFQILMSHLWLRLGAWGCWGRYLLGGQGARVSDLFPHFPISVQSSCYQSDLAEAPGLWTWS